MSAPAVHHDEAGIALMRADIDRQAAVLEAAIPALRAAARDAVDRLPDRPGRSYLVGCGDSLDGGIAARFAWDRIVGMPVEAVPAMTFATSVAPEAPAGSLVVALSQSGKVSRVVEAVRAARHHGLRTIAITANGGSALAQEPADVTWVMDFEKLGAIPGTTSHLLGGVALLELGAALATEASAGEPLRRDLDLLPAIVRQVTEVVSPVAAGHAAAMARDLPFLSIGYGPVLSSARFTVRKLLELTQIVALWQETEEYAHDEYSLVDERFRVLQFAPADRGATRSVEIATYLRRLGVHLAVVTDTDSAGSYRELADEVYALPPMPVSLVPLAHAIPGQLLSVGSADRLGGSLYGMAERIHREDGDPQIYESEKWVG